MGGGASKRIGKEGEKEVDTHFRLAGWVIADKETQGLAGDDLFARDPAGTWHSIEVKKVRTPDPKYRKQAIDQAVIRAASIREALKNPNSMASLLGITFDPRNWLLVWRPKDWGSATHFVCVNRHGFHTLEVLK